MNTRKLKALLGLVLASAVLAQGALAQQAPTTAELKKDIEALKESLRAIQKDLQEIKALLQSRPPTAPGPAPQNFLLDIGNHPFKGLPTARLTLVEFSDYQ